MKHCYEKNTNAKFIDAREQAMIKLFNVLCKAVEQLV